MLWISCNHRSQTFADTLSETDTDTALILCINYIDSLARYRPESMMAEIRQICHMFFTRGFEETATQIACYPYGINPNDHPDIARRLLTSTLLPGKKAPEIVVGETSIQLGENSKHTLVFFYESRCRSCQQMIDLLIQNYARYKKAGVWVITLSADTDNTLFESYSEKFPWTDKLCDFLYYDSPNFVAYGVANVPAIFLINGKGIVTEQLNSLQEIELHVK